jgi:hypothetical protein
MVQEVVNETVGGPVLSFRLVTQENAVAKYQWSDGMDIGRYHVIAAG